MTTSGGATPRAAAGVMHGPEHATLRPSDLEPSLRSPHLEQLSKLALGDARGEVQMVQYYCRHDALEPSLINAYRRRSAFEPVEARSQTKAVRSALRTRHVQAKQLPANEPIFTALEQQAVVSAAVVQACSVAAMGMTQAASLQVKLALCGGDLGVSAVATASLISAVSACSFFLQPVVGALSDTLGRRPFMMLEPLARIGWFSFLTSRLCSSLDRYVIAAVLNFGVLGAGGHLVREAALDDLFGRRAAVRAGIQAQQNFYSSILNTVCPIIGAEVSRRSNQMAHYLGMLLLLLQLGTSSLFMPETLRREERRPFKIRAMNPLSNMAVLFTHGAGLRGFAIINFLYNFANGCNQNKGDYAMTAMDWVPQDISYLQSFESLVNVFSQRIVVMRMIRTFGARGAFVHGSLFSATAYILISIAWFPPSASKLQKTLVFLLGHLIWAGGHVGPLALRTLTVKQGLSVKPPLGRGELNAALGGMGAIVRQAYLASFDFVTASYHPASSALWINLEAADLSEPCGGGTGWNDFATVLGSSIQILQLG